MQEIDHSSRSHALLSASSANRWIHCNPSARLEDQYPDQTSKYALEGTLAHEFAEIELRKSFGMITPQKATALIKGIMRDNIGTEFSFLDMKDHAKSYAEYIKEMATDDCSIIVEETVDYSDYVPEGFGTADCIVINEKEKWIVVVDYKYGKGVQVDAVDNPQMRLYALGAEAAYGTLTDFESVGYCIYQPRLDHISIETIKTQDLKGWANNVVKPAAELAYQGKGEEFPGDWCRFCKHEVNCKAMRDLASSTIREEFRDSNDQLSQEILSETDIGEILSKKSIISHWLNAVEEKALKDMLDGKKIAGWKVVEGRSIRTYTDTDKVIDRLKAEGYEEALLYKPREILNISSLEKMMGKKKFSDLLQEYITKPQGKPNVVPETDKRPEFKKIEASDFEEEEEEEK